MMAHDSSSLRSLWTLVLTTLQSLSYRAHESMWPGLTTESGPQTLRGLVPAGSQPHRRHRDQSARRKTLSTIDRLNPPASERMCA